MNPNPVQDLTALKHDLAKLISEMKSAGIPVKLIASIDRKCLLTPRRQTGRIDRRTNRNPRWSITLDHPDYAPERGAHLVRLRLFLEMLQMANAPVVDQELMKSLSLTHLGVPLTPGPTKDPLTDEVLDFTELVNDVVHKPKHGYSKFHIGHQDPRFHPKHLHQNVHWQFKASNDFQTTMDIRVARIAYEIDRFTRTGDKQLFDRAMEELALLSATLLKKP
jgi:hypothetical protein